MRFFSSCFAGLLALGAPLPAPAGLPAPLPAAIRRVLPAGYAVLAAEPGDLNRDATPDWVVVLNKPDEKRTSDVNGRPTKRPLLFVGGVGGTFTLAGRAGNAVYCVDCGGMMGDPFQGVTIKNGYFTVKHYGGSAQRWTRFVTFRYNPAARTWLLHRDGGEQFSASDPAHGTSSGTTARNFGRVLFTRFDIYR